MDYNFSVHVIIIINNKHLYLLYNTIYVGVTRSHIKLKGLNVPMSTQNTAVKIYNLPLIQVLYKEELGISVYEIGNPIPGQPFIEKVLMLLGATGAGKTTLINRMVNHIYGVQWDDDFRFQLIPEEIAKTQTLITIYTIYPSLESHFPHTLTIVDTPSFADAKHDQIFQQIKEIFSNTLQGKKGIDHLDGIGFVIQSSLVSLTVEQCMFNSIVSIFGNDVANNIFMMVTFADASKPPVMTAIEGANIKFKKIFKFNNSALYISNSSGCEIQEHDFNSTFWKLGENSFKYFFENLCDIEQISLCLTKEVLRKRKHLEIAHQAVQQQIDVGVTKLEPKQEDTVHQSEVNLAGNKDFPCQVLATKVVNPLNVYSTNCSVCEYTCHAECNAPDIYDCSHMDDGVKMLPAVNIALGDALGEITNEAHTITRFTKKKSGFLKKCKENSKIFQCRYLQRKLIIRIKIYFPTTAHIVSLHAILIAMHHIFTIVHPWIMGVKMLPVVENALVSVAGRNTNGAHTTTRFT